MKKYSLFKILGLVFLGYFLLTWIIPGSYYSGGLESLDIYPAGIPQIFQILVQSIGYFSYLFIFILLIGGLYSVLEATGVYRKLLDKIVEKTKNFKHVILISIVIVLAIISSIAGLEMGMFIVFPFLISLFILMGYDMIIALLATFGATIVGVVGNTYASSINLVTNSILGVEVKNVILVKILILFGSLAILIGFIFVLKMILDNKKANAKTKKDKKETVSIPEFIPDQVEAEKNPKKKGWPILLIFGIVMFILTIWSIDWSTAFEIEWFKNAYTSITTWTLGDLKIFAKIMENANEIPAILEFPIFGKIFGGLSVVGTWIDVNKYIYYAIVVLFGSVTLGLVYGIKFNDYIKAMLEGMKKYLGTGLLVIMAYSILVLASSFPIFLTGTNWFINVLGDKLDIATISITSLFGSALHVDMYYYPQYALQYYQGLGNIDSNILSVLFVSIYGIAMLIAPTSTLLLATLNTTKTKYFDWLKYAIILFAVLLFMVLIVLTIFNLV